VGKLPYLRQLYTSSAIFLFSKADLKGSRRSAAYANSSLPVFIHGMAWQDQRRALRGGVLVEWLSAPLSMTMRGLCACCLLYLPLRGGFASLVLILFYLFIYFIYLFILIFIYSSKVSIETNFCLHQPSSVSYCVSFYSWFYSGVILHAINILSVIHL
jgi:hypothetical protein